MYNQSRQSNEQRRNRQRGQPFRGKPPQKPPPNSGSTDTSLNSEDSDSATPTLQATSSHPKTAQSHQQPQQQQHYHHQPPPPQQQPPQLAQPSHCYPSQADREAYTLCSDVHCSLMRATDSVYSMPLSEHILYSSYDSYNNIMLEQRRSLDEMMSKLSTCSDKPLQAAQQNFNTTSLSYMLPQSDYARVDFNTIQSLRDKYDTIHEFSEQVFDRIGHNLDEAEGLLTRDAQLVQATLDAANNSKVTTNLGHEKHRAQQNNKTSSKILRNRIWGAKIAMLENKNIPRPQNFFKDKIDNSYRPFEPLIVEKYNARVPLNLSLRRDEQGNEYYAHPYEYEIQSLTISPDVLLIRDVIEPPDLESTPIREVDTIDQLEKMCEHIEAQTEFAVDVEHHSYRSFQGITCLLQISTRTQDFVIDAIKLRGELHRLNKSFTDPNIVKVFHGADCDVLWLQRDFGVYVVNLFDTSRAAKLMKFAHLSLAFLMKHYCDQEPDKSYQLADWRERPLPRPMLEYAREDTHFLLKIYDRLRLDLSKKGGPRKGAELIKSVFERGQELCLKRYEKPPFSDTSHMSVLRKSRSTFNAKQMYAFKELYAWRDAISRELDESVGYVLPNNLMIRIAEYLPAEPQGITALCCPIPPTVKKYLSDIHAIILKSLDVPLTGPSIYSTGNQLITNPNFKSVDLDIMGHKQDIAHSADLHDCGVPNLLDRMHTLKCSNDPQINHNGSRDNGRNLNLAKNINQSPSRIYNFLESKSKSGFQGKSRKSSRQYS